MGQWDERDGYKLRYIYEQFFKNQHNTSALTRSKIRYLYATTTGMKTETLPSCNLNTCFQTNCLCKIKETDKHEYSKMLSNSKYSLCFYGDNPTSSRIYDALASHTIPIFISDQLFTDGLAFIQKIPWRDFSYVIPVQSSFEEIERQIIGILGESWEKKSRKFQLMKRWREEVSWSLFPENVAHNFVSEAYDRCVEPFLVWWMRERGNSSFVIQEGSFWRAASAKILGVEAKWIDY